MTKNLDNEGLRSIVESYDFFFIDLWGVIHNGITLHKNAIKTLTEISNTKKNYVLLTNAPRPNNTVKMFLKKMGMDKSILEKVYTSGEAALNYLKKNHLNEKFYHIGPPRDFDLFLDFKEKKKKNINECNYFLCTGLFDKYDQDLNYYKKLFSGFISKKMICTNPDLVVDRGKKREFCAGSVAKICPRPTEKSRHCTTMRTQTRENRSTQTQLSDKTPTLHYRPLPCQNKKPSETLP